MADQTVVDAPQAGADTQPQAGDSANPQAGESPKTYSEAAYKKVTSEAHNLRTRLRELEEKENAALPEVDRTKKELLKLQAERDALRIEVHTNRVMSVASKAGALYPDAVVRLIPSDTDDIEKAVQQVQKQYPALFPKGSADGGQGASNGQHGQLSMNDIIRKRMNGG